MKHQPWLFFNEETFAEPKSAVGSTSSSSPKPSPLPAPDKFKWALFGPYNQSYVIYNGKYTASLMVSNYTAQIANFFWARFSSTGDVGITLL